MLLVHFSVSKEVYCITLSFEIDTEQLNDMLNSLNLNITHVHSNNNFAYRDVISHKILKTGKKNTQKIERKHLTFRTHMKRLARKTICCSKLNYFNTRSIPSRISIFSIFKIIFIIFAVCKHKKCLALDKLTLSFFTLSAL